MGFFQSKSVANSLQLPLQPLSYTQFQKNPSVNWIPYKLETSNPYVNDRNIEHKQEHWHNDLNQTSRHFRAHNTSEEMGFGSAHLQKTT